MKPILVCCIADLDNRQWICNQIYQTVVAKTNLALKETKEHGPFL